jgi:hypothetical protein
MVLVTMRFIKRPSKGIDETQAKNSRICSEFSREENIGLIRADQNIEARLLALQELFHGS